MSSAIISRGDCATSGSSHLGRGCIVGPAVVMRVPEGQRPLSLLVLGLGYLSLVVGEPCECTPKCESGFIMPENCARLAYQITPTSCTCTNACDLEKCRDDFVQDSVDESMCELLTGAARNAQNYVAEVCKSPSIDCFKPSGCAKCLAGYVLSEDKTCIDSPCKNRRCPEASARRKFKEKLKKCISEN